MVDIESTEIESSADYDGIDHLWSSYTGGIGPIGQYVARLSPEECALVKAAISEDVGDGPFSLTAVAWAAVGTVSG